MDQSNRYSCSNCEEKQRAKKKICLTHCPSYLFLSLNRFFYDFRTNQGGKLLHEISFDPIIVCREDTSHIKQARHQVVTDQESSLQSMASSSTQTTGGRKRGEKIYVRYGLYGIIYHSGLTADNR
eukprot:UN20647